jgi:hypothetical protein
VGGGEREEFRAARETGHDGRSKKENMAGEGPQQAAISRRVHHYPRAREMSRPVWEMA